MYTVKLTPHVEWLTEIITTLQKVGDVWHGSGVNYDWVIDMSRTHVTLSNAWTHYGESGMHEDTFPFEFSIPICYDWTKHWKFRFRGDIVIRSRARKTGVRDYLEDTFVVVLDDVLHDDVLHYETVGSD